MILHRHMTADGYEPPRPSEQASEPWPEPITTRAVSIEDRMRHRKSRKVKRAAVYAGTRNLYQDMVPAAKSMIMNAPVDKVYFLIEDSRFPEWLPDMVECVDVRDQPWFDKTGPNYINIWSYMCLMKMTLAKLFPEYSRILMVDVDTIVDMDISELWEMDMGDNMFGMVQEYLVNHGGVYHNCGVLLQNLDLIRKEKADDRLIEILNTEKLQYPEQDAMNRNYSDRIMDLDLKYNGSFCCGYVADVAIWHYAGTPAWRDNHWIKGYEYQRKYRDKSWDEVLVAHKERYG